MPGADESVGQPPIAPQGGADVARLMLAEQYDRVTGRWSVAQVGELWDAVRLAHDLGRFGDGMTVAVVDDGFDLSLPALATCDLAWPCEDADLTAHGSVVALLILAVAPRATLRLYPCAVAGRWSEDRLVAALEDAGRRRADIVNVSAGAPLPQDGLIDRSRGSVLNAPDVWSDLSGDYLSFYTDLKLSETSGWRDVLDPPATRIGSAATQAAQQGATVVVATGNQSADVFTPAVEESVFSVGFRVDHRVLPPGAKLEVAFGGAPEQYAQSMWGSDFQVRQPAGVLGSSFATPLVSGFAALMADRRELVAYRKVGFLAGLAADAFARLPDGPWDEHRHGVARQIFDKAVRELPHPHHQPELRVPCPECALFAIDTYVNVGLMMLFARDVDGAETMLATACAVAPSHAQAFANYGVLLGHRAATARAAQDWDRVVALLDAAQSACLRAVLLRPDYAPFKVRYDEYLVGSMDPTGWIPVP